ncbi:MAG: prephenate dehydratase [bacterium]|nr:MAG: prephenate dehydratase [bacterium]
MEAEPTVAYLGPVATFTHQAARKAFGDGARYVPAETIEGVFNMVKLGLAQRGVVPVENSNEGAVTSTMDLLVESSLVIVGEVILPISLMLLSRERVTAGIRTVYSHPQALAQCRKWLTNNLPGAELVGTRSTAEAAALCQAEGGAAAVAGEMAGELYNLPVLERDIGDWEENLTRFLIFSEESVPPSGSDKTSLVFSIKDRVGALYEMLKPFSENSINLTRIESRPSKKKAWDYLFFVDFDGHRDDRRVEETLAKLSDLCMFVKVLGSYPKGTVENSG